jgi:DNA-binding Lrp family transcriptional regulator
MCLGKGMKDIERKLISELLKNSRRSDRDLAKAIGTSQPTVSRLIKKLEKEGYVKDYPMIPDFQNLGFKLMAFTLVKFTKPITTKDIEAIRKAALNMIRKTPIAILMGMNILGMGYERLLVSLHEDYSSFKRVREMARQLPNADVERIDSFIVDFTDKNHFYPLGFSAIADYLSTARQEKKK